MALSSKERELAAVGISVASGCKPCTNYHIKMVQQAGASQLEISRAVNVALNIQSAAADVMGDHAFAQLGEEEYRSNSTMVSDSDRLTELVCMGAAFAVNCVSILKNHLAAAQAVGVSTDEIDEIVKLAAFIKDRAASHVERLVGIRDAENPAVVAARYKSTFAPHEDVSNT